LGGGWCKIWSVAASDSGDRGLPENSEDGWLADVADNADPFTAWREMREREGATVTLIELYALVAEPRGLEPHELPLTERRNLAERAYPLLKPGFQHNPGSRSRALDPVEVTRYDPDWPARFKTWRARLAVLLGPVALRIEHVGSTSVPGLEAKPIVDIQVSVAALDDEDGYVPPCEAAGLQFRFRENEHRYFVPPPGHRREVQVHVCQHAGGWERRHLLFRDFLRASKEAQETYAAAKRLAASVWADDRAAYNEAKSAAILSILGQAEAWAEGTSWAL
jgi:GrpB-like predicted nucleotidyltransferase (UPF0157 family)